MAKLTIITAQWDFEDAKEAKAAQILTEGNRQLIQSAITTERIRRENLVPDPNNYAAFIQEEAEIKGAIRAFQHLLNLHEDTMSSLSTESNEALRG